jgi:membrane protein DedA with SNARE-associated domain
MPLRRWIPAMLVGTLIWGVIYGTVGMAVVWAWLEQPWVVAPVVVAVLLLLLGHRIRARRRARGERRDEDLPISR